MKKFTKNILLVALFSLIIGVLITIIAAISGGASEVWRLSKEKMLEVPIFNDTVFGIRLDDDHFSLGLFDDEDIKSGVSTGELVKVEAEVPVKSVEIMVGFGDVEILPSEDEFVYYSVTGYIGKYGVKVDDSGVFRFVSADDKISIMDVTAGKVVFYIPDSVEKDYYQLELGAGNLDVKDIKDYGNVTISMGAGECDIKHIKANSVKIECGAGNVDLGLVSTDKLSAECGCGNFDATLTGDCDDYNYEIDAGIGNIDIGNKSYTGLGQEHSENNGASKTVSIDCGLGNVDIQFE